MKSPRAGTTELILIRHGETVWNREARWQGHLDSDLTPAGLQQAQAIAGRLARVDFAALYSSDLGRAKRTAEHISVATGRPVLTEPGLRERALGVFQGLTLGEIRERFPQEFGRFQQRDPDHVIPEGESLRGKHERAVACLERIARVHAGASVIIVTHGGVLDSAFRLALGLPLSHLRRWVLYNGSLNTFLHDNGDWSLGTWGDISHLHRAGTLDDY
jgi:probable phosphoglycerate mutase